MSKTKKVLLCYDSSMLDAQFSNIESLKRHYIDHVLQLGEEFDPSNPKFPYMTIQEYIERAKNLAMTRAGHSDDYRPETEYVGFISQRKGCGQPRPRFIKFRKKSEFNEEFGEIVVYVKGYGEYRDEIISYYMTRPHKLFKEKMNRIAELPENTNIRVKIVK